MFFRHLHHHLQPRIKINKKFLLHLQYLHSKKRLYIVSLTWPPVAAILFVFGLLVDNQLVAEQLKLRNFQILRCQSIQKIEVNSRGVITFSEERYPIKILICLHKQSQHNMVFYLLLEMNLLLDLLKFLHISDDDFIIRNILR